MPDTTPTPEGVRERVAKALYEAERMRLFGDLEGWTWGEYREQNMSGNKFWTYADAVLAAAGLPELREERKGWCGRCEVHVTQADCSWWPEWTTWVHACGDSILLTPKTGPEETAGDLRVKLAKATSLLRSAAEIAKRESDHPNSTNWAGFVAQVRDFLAGSVESEQ